MSPGPAAAPPVPAPVPPSALPAPGRPGAATPSSAPAPGRGVWRIGWLPRSLAARTAIFLLLALMLVQAAGLLIHALDRVDLQRFVERREISGRAMGLWRTLIIAPPDRRDMIVNEVDLPEGLTASLDDAPTARNSLATPGEDVLSLLPPEAILNLPPRLQPREMVVGTGKGQALLVSLRLPNGDLWLNLRLRVPPPRPWHSPTFLIAFGVMTVAAALLIVAATRRLIRPVRDLARAAEALGRDVNAPPLPETGPLEVATAAHAFNTMAERIRRFVGDRTQMLAAIGHDLRTPITRLRLRAEFLEDDEQRRRMLSDLDEMEAMVNATLAFARDDAADEPSVPLDLAALCRTVLDEEADARPEAEDALTYTGPLRLTVRGRPIALKRALMNLVGNALKYGQAARIRLEPPSGRQNPVVRLFIEDDGPGVPEESQEAVFQPFRRLETSRNRETGGTGLGLPIARNILRAHGGDVTLENLPEGGLRAVVTLPV
ncbi:ATP-binding protein [Roseomonas gilardii]|uniref:ATP-binding protein n=1 Tax=Roseomonas gilardii TaxID=257708 RepID=UPI0004B6A2E6|nr:ATP-binding protein [Roseomonas gilardii]SUE43317.1 Osmolarity sensor protein EnvZ [Roseomonas gilardii subsp. rosea]